MGQLVQSGPLVVIVDAVSWQDYLGGIIQHHCSSQWSNHAVLVVGYDTTGKKLPSSAQRENHCLTRTDVNFTEITVKVMQLSKNKICVS